MFKLLKFIFRNRFGSITLYTASRLTFAVTSCKAAISDGFNIIACAECAFDNDEMFLWSSTLLPMLLGFIIICLYIYHSLCLESLYPYSISFSFLEIHENPMSSMTPSLTPYGIAFSPATTWLPARLIHTYP